MMPIGASHLADKYTVNIKTFAMTRDHKLKCSTIVMLNDGMNLGFHCTMPSLQICLDIEINGPSDLHVKPTKLFI